MGRCANLGLRFGGLIFARFLHNKISACLDTALLIIASIIFTHDFLFLLFVFFKHFLVIAQILFFIACFITVVRFPTRSGLGGQIFRLSIYFLIKTITKTMVLHTGFNQCAEPPESAILVIAFLRFLQELAWGPNIFRPFFFLLTPAGP